jgi:hypothetical protein
MKTVLGIVPVIRRLDKAALEPVPTEMVRDLSSLYSPEQINEIVFQYRIWSFLMKLDDCCEGCGGFMPIGSRSTTKTCSNRCHQLVKRAYDKGQVSPIQEMRNQAEDKMSQINLLWEKASKGEYKRNFAWHQVTEGWRVLSIMD